MGNHNVIISVKEGADPAAGRVVTEHDGNRTIVVTSDPASIVATAVEAVDEGAGRIELCGAMAGEGDRSRGPSGAGGSGHVRVRVDHWRR